MLGTASTSPRALPRKMPKRRWYRELPPILRINALKLVRDDSVDAPQFLRFILETTRQFHPGLGRSRRCFTHDDLSAATRLDSLPPCITIGTKFTSATS